MNNSELKALGFHSWVELYEYLTEEAPVPFIITELDYKDESGHISTVFMEEIKAKAFEELYHQKKNEERAWPHGKEAAEREEPEQPAPGPDPEPRPSFFWRWRGLFLYLAGAILAFFTVLWAKHQSIERERRWYGHHYPHYHETNQAGELENGDYIEAAAASITSWAGFLVAGVTGLTRSEWMETKVKEYRKWANQPAK